jgi:hypothetical protein
LTTKPTSSPFSFLVCHNNLLLQRNPFDSLHDTDEIPFLFNATQIDPSHTREQSATQLQFAHQLATACASTTTVALPLRLGDSAISTSNLDFCCTFRPILRGFSESPSFAIPIAP